jgi:hypothetical protein
MIRKLAFVIALPLAGCAATTPAGSTTMAIPHAAASVCAPGAAPATTSSGAMCTDTFAQKGSGAEGLNVDALLFDSCEQFLPAFLDVVRASCTSAAPELVKALVDEQSTRLLRKGDPSDDSFYVDLAHATRPFVPAGCLEHFPTDREDVGRQIFEIKKDWRECYPDPELLGAFTKDWGAMVTYASSSINASEYFWAVAIAPHMTPLDRQFLRKFLVCGQFVAPPSFVQAWPETQYPYGDPGADEETDVPPPVTKPPVSRHPPKR